MAGRDLSAHQAHRLVPSAFDKRIPPAKAGEASEIRIGCTDLQVVLDRKSGKMSVGCEIAARSSGPEKAEENRRMPIAGVKHRDL
jgi:hypothetical protein